MYRREPVARRDNGPPAELIDYIGAAIGLRMAALQARNVPPVDEAAQSIALDQGSTH